MGYKHGLYTNSLKQEAHQERSRNSVYNQTSRVGRLVLMSFLKRNLKKKRIVRLWVAKSRPLPSNGCTAKSEPSVHVAINIPFRLALGMTSVTPYVNYVQDFSQMRVYSIMLLISLKATLVLAGFIWLIIISHYARRSTFFSRDSLETRAKST